MRSELRYTGGSDAAARASRMTPAAPGPPSRQQEDASVIAAPIESAMKSDGGNTPDPAMAAANGASVRFSDLNAHPLSPGSERPSEK